MWTPRLKFARGAGDLWSPSILSDKSQLFTKNELQHVNNVMSILQYHLLFYF